MSLLALINDDTIIKYALPTACIIIGLLVITIIIKFISGSPIITHHYNKALKKRRRNILTAIWIIFMILMALALFDGHNFDRERINAFIILGVASFAYIFRALILINRYRK